MRSAQTINNSTSAAFAQSVMCLLKHTIVLWAMIAATASLALGQANAKVSGTVTDPNGAAVPGAVVKLVNQATKI